MKLRMVGCSHHHAGADVRERLAFTPEEAAAALTEWRDVLPGAEGVLLATCNRVEFYASRQGTWTMLEMTADGFGCVASHGNGLQVQKTNRGPRPAS